MMRTGILATTAALVGLAIPAAASATPAIPTGSAASPASTSASCLQATAAGTDGDRSVVIASNACPSSTLMVSVNSYGPDPACAPIHGVLTDLPGGGNTGNQTHDHRFVAYDITPGDVYECAPAA